jgi:hypothetical protein
MDAGAGVDSAWEQKKTRSQPVLVIAQGKMLENAAESHKSTARFVRRLYECKTRKQKKKILLPL